MFSISVYFDAKAVLDKDAIEIQFFQFLIFVFISNRSSA